MGGKGNEKRGRKGKKEGEKTEKRAERKRREDKIGQGSSVNVYWTEEGVKLG